MKRFLVLFSALVLASLPIAASAQTVSEAVAGLDDGVYVADGLSADEGELADAVNRARNAGLGLYVVLLDEDPSSGATAFADSVLNQLGDGTVLVLSASSEGMASTEIGQSAIEAALDSGFAAGGGDVGYVKGVVDSVARSSGSTGSTDSGTDNGGGSGWLILLVIVGGLVLLVWWAISRSNKASAARRGGLVVEARGEIKSQLDSMANTILEISDLVSASETTDDNNYLEKAGVTYSEALESYEAADSLRALEDLSDRLDEARWQLDAATAISEGRSAPKKPTKKERPVCFFDPSHRDATEMADIQTSSGTRTVRVCRPDAERLRKGTTPDPRMINVGGRQVPAPMAPKSHGGGGMDWLEAFSMMAGGVGQVSYDWGRSRRGRVSRGSSGSTSRATRSTSQPKPDRARAGRTRRRRR